MGAVFHYIGYMQTLDTLTRLRQLMIKQEVHIGNLNPIDTGIIMVAATFAIPEGQSLTEKDVTERLYQWVTTIGSNVRADAIELRRYLIDCHCLKRDPAGRVYTRSAEWPPQWKEIAAELETLDIDSFADQVRIEEIEHRAARKKAALEKKGGL
jgi:hypothetical protein